MRRNLQNTAHLIVDGDIVAVVVRSRVDRRDAKVVNLVVAESFEADRVGRRRRMLTWQIGPEALGLSMSPLTKQADLLPPPLRRLESDLPLENRTGLCVRCDAAWFHQVSTLGGCKTVPRASASPSEG